MNRQEIDADIQRAQRVALELRKIGDRQAANDRGDEAAERLEAARAIERLAIIAGRDETDQGYVNHETFGVAMYLAGNLTSSATHNEAREIVRDVSAAVPGGSGSIGAVTATAERLEAWCGRRAHGPVEALHGGDGTALTTELLTAALGRVEWRQLATEQLDELAEDAG